ncbi:MAG: glutamate-5-semialdehyde dehydrogenase [Deltaproteobacteria bacterium]|nr:glutamate-5-semialdehyde dehydrogenase [Deltaproteobacteria bacterium]
MEQILEMAKRAKMAASALATLSSPKRKAALLRIADNLERRENEIVTANEKDVEEGKKKKLSNAMIDRLILDSERISSMAAGIREIAEQPDPVGEVTRMWTRPNGLLVGKMRIPLGVVGIIYESRPNVTADAAALCLKSGNAVLLRGGSEALESNLAIGRIIQGSLSEEGVPEEVVQVIPIADRNAILVMVQLEDYLDLIIPRGGEGLIRFVVENSRVPVIKHYKGVCHVFVDESADLEMAQAICVNAKVQRPGVCNAMETLLVHEAVAEEFLPKMVEKFRELGVEIRGCSKTQALCGKDVVPATEEDWPTEYLDLILSVKVVAGLDEAVSHIEKYGSSHTESIVTKDYANAQAFLRRVNSSVVLVNASTRFSDGQQLGLGAEIGISTTKLHAFGPMGAQDLTTTKFIIFGEGQVRTS